MTRLQAYRHASDYAYVFDMAPEDVKVEIDGARELVDRARASVGAA